MTLAAPRPKPLIKPSGPLPSGGYPARATRGRLALGFNGRRACGLEPGRPPTPPRGRGGVGGWRAAREGVEGRVAPTVAGRAAPQAQDSGGGGARQPPNPQTPYPLPGGGGVGLPGPLVSPPPPPRLKKPQTSREGLR